MRAIILYVYVALFIGRCEELWLRVSAVIGNLIDVVQQETLRTWLLFALDGLYLSG